MENQNLLAAVLLKHHIRSAPNPDHASSDGSFFSARVSARLPILFTEESIHVGDEFAVKTAKVIVTQARPPCYKLGIRFESDDMVKRFFASSRPGFFLAVTAEGEVAAGDDMRVINHDSNGVPISQMFRLYAAKRYDEADIAWVQRALDTAALPESWKKYFRKKLQQIPTCAEKPEI